MRTLGDWRREQAISIYDLAIKAGVSNKTISDVENGKVMPKFRTIRRLCAALGVQPGDVTEFVRPRPETTDTDTTIDG